MTDEMERQSCVDSWGDAASHDRPVTGPLDIHMWAHDAALSMWHPPPRAVKVLFLYLSTCPLAGFFLLLFEFCLAFTCRPKPTRPATQVKKGTKEDFTAG